MTHRYIELAGVELDLMEDLSFNLNRLAVKLKNKWSYDSIISETFDKLKTSDKSFGVVDKAMLRMRLWSKYVSHKYQEKERSRKIENLQDLLIEYYRSPEKSIARTKLQCEVNIANYQSIISQINNERVKLLEGHEVEEIGHQIKEEIQALLVQYDEKLLKRRQKLDFYQDCLQRISILEQKMKVIENLKESKEKIQQLNDDPSDDPNEIKLKQQVEMYNEFGDLLNNISNNISRINKDENDQVAPEELKSIVEIIKL